MTTKRKKGITLTTPRAKCRWARLRDPKPGFENKGAPSWQVVLEMVDTNKEHMAFMAELQTYYDSEYARLLEESGKRKAMKFDLFKDEKDGALVLRCMQKAYWTDSDGNNHENRRPTVVDSVNNPFPIDDVLIGNGSVVRAKIYVQSFMTALGFGLKIYLNSVQIIELEEYEGAGGGFEPVKKGYVAPAPKVIPAPPVAAPASEFAFGDEDIPF